jgi:hypothetical protein
MEQPSHWSVQQQGTDGLVAEVENIHKSHFSHER